MRLLMSCRLRQLQQPRVGGAGDQVDERLRGGPQAPKGGAEEGQELGHPALGRPPQRRLLRHAAEVRHRHVTLPPSRPFSSSDLLPPLVLVLTGGRCTCTTRPTPTCRPRRTPRCLLRLPRPTTWRRPPASTSRRSQQHHKDKNDSNNNHQQACTGDRRGREGGGMGGRTEADCQATFSAPPSSSMASCIFHRSYIHPDGDNDRHSCTLSRRKPRTTTTSMTTAAARAIGQGTSERRDPSRPSWGGGHSISSVSHDPFLVS